MKAFIVWFKSPYSMGFKYVICENEYEIKNYVPTVMSGFIDRHQEVKLNDIELERLNCASFLNLLKMK